MWTSESKSFEAFLRKVLKYCENKSVVDRGFWYLWTLKRLAIQA